MSIFRKPPVQTLSEWLEIATRKLTDASKERIRVEIEAHYSEAVEAHRENGLSEADAQTTALMQLGDAKAAAKRFRKQHLTESEEKTLKQSEKWCRSFAFLIFSYLFFGNIAAGQFSMRQNAWHHYHDPSLGLLVQFIVLIALPTICFAIARFGRTERKRHLLLLRFVSGIFMGVLLNDLLAGVSPYENWFDAFLGVAIICYFLQGIHLWIKLGRIGPIRSRTPPPDTAPV